MTSGSKRVTTILDCSGLDADTAFERYSFYLDLDTNGSHVFEIVFVKGDDEELFERGRVVSKGSIVTAGVGVLPMAGRAWMYRARDLTLEE